MPLGASPFFSVVAEEARGPSRFFKGIPTTIREERLNVIPPPYNRTHVRDGG
jgi:hypothetical protein